jgi:hypothetical protein
LTEDLAGTEEADSSDDDPTTEAYWLARGLSPESAKASAAKERDKRDEEFTGGYDPTNGNYYGPRGGQR